MKCYQCIYNHLHVNYVATVVELRVVQLDATFVTTNFFFAVPENQIVAGTEVGF